MWNIQFSQGDTVEHPISTSLVKASKEPEVLEPDEFEAQSTQLQNDLDDAINEVLKKYVKDEGKKGRVKMVALGLQVAHAALSRKAGEVEHELEHYVLDQHELKKIRDENASAGHATRFDAILSLMGATHSLAVVRLRPDVDNTLGDQLKDESEKAKVVSKPMAKAKKEESE